MSETLSTGRDNAAAPTTRLSAALVDRVVERLGRAGIPFDVVFPDGSRRLIGSGTPTFTVTLRTKEAVRTFASMDEGRIGDA